MPLAEACSGGGFPGLVAELAGGGESTGRAEWEIAYGDNGSLGLHHGRQVHRSMCCVQVGFQIFAGRCGGFRLNASS